MTRFLSIPSLLLLLSVLLLSSTPVVEARIPRHSNFKRQTVTAAHSGKRGSLELGKFNNFPDCIDGCGTYFNSLFESNSALRRNRRAREEAVSSLQDCEWVCTELHPETFDSSHTDQMVVEIAHLSAPAAESSSVSPSLFMPPF
ncbi:hypothetical protein BDY24DRAFT_439094 [Mrakia frigida]|uniref:uncharacterized protein n=1 Tax=Mrakia frigida TaxID=29902 RepID=UPI003FCBF6F3